MPNTSPPQAANVVPNDDGPDASFGDDEDDGEEPVRTKGVKWGSRKYNMFNVSLCLAGFCHMLR